MQKNSPSISVSVLPPLPAPLAALFTWMRKDGSAQGRTDELITRQTERKSGWSFTAERKNTLTKEREAWTAFVISIPKCLSGGKKAYFACMRVRVKTEFFLKNQYKVNKNQECQNSGASGKVLWWPVCARDSRLLRRPPNKPIFKPKICPRFVTNEHFSNLVTANVKNQLPKKKTGLKLRVLF